MLILIIIYRPIIWCDIIIILFCHAGQSFIAASWIHALACLHLIEDWLCWIWCTDMGTVTLCHQSSIFVTHDRPNFWRNSDEKPLNALYKKVRLITYAFSRISDSTPGASTGCDGLKLEATSFLARRASLPPNAHPLLNAQCRRNYFYHYSFFLKLVAA